MAQNFQINNNGNFTPASKSLLIDEDVTFSLTGNANYQTVYVYKDGKADSTLFGATSVSVSATSTIQAGASGTYTLSISSTPPGERQRGNNGTIKVGGGAAGDE